MGEAEAPAAAEEPQVADGAVAVEITEGSSAKGEVPTKLPKRLPKPNKEEMLAKANVLHETIKARKARSEEINSIISGKNRQSESPELVQVKNKLQALRAQWDAELSNKQHLRGELEKVSLARKELRAQTKDMKAKMAYLTNGSRIDDQIAALEHRLAHSSMPLAEEKKTLEDIKKLKASRATSAAYDDRLEKLASDDKLWNDIKEKMGQCDVVLDSITKKQDAVRGELKAAKDKESERSSDLPALYKERTECREVMQEAWETIKAMREEFQAQNNVYWEAEQEFRAWRNADRERKQKAWAEEKAAKDKEYAAQRAEMAGEHFDKEVQIGMSLRLFWRIQVTMCDQLTCYLNKFVVAAAPAAAAGPAAGEAAAIDGYKVLVKKREDADDVFGLSAAKRGAKKGKKGAAARVADKANADVKLVHSLDIISSFSALGVQYPLTASAAPAAINALAERKAHYLEKRAELKESGVLPGDEGLAAEARSRANGHATPSASKPAANGYHEVDMTVHPETVHLKITVNPGEDVAVAFNVKSAAFPSLAGKQ